MVRQARTGCGGWIWGTSLAATLLVVSGCGGDKGKNEDPGSGGIKAEVFKFASGKAAVTFDGAAAGEQYVLMPLSLGDPASIEGATAETFTYTLSVAAGGGSLRLLEPAPVSDARFSAYEYQHSMRTLLNRFDDRRGEDQGAWFWSLARRLDAEAAYHMPEGHATLLESDGPGFFERGFRRKARQSATLERAFSATTTAGDCPKAGQDVIIPDIDDHMESDTALIGNGKAVSGADYCIVYVSDPVTGGSKEEIEASIKSLMARYKAIYQSDFPAAGDYTFKPVFVIIDFDPAGQLWPPALQNAGIYINHLSTAAKMPMLYMPSDLQKVGTNKGDPNYDAALQKKLWHGTLAHELQHAIINYFRVRVGGHGDENPSLDEGIAHYMEDVFGYGSENFMQFAGKYLSVWTYGEAPLHATDDSAVNRGGAHTLLYYLTSQKGGLSFKDGAVSGGGLDFLTSVVKDSGGKKGPANLAAKFGEDWMQTAANYFGALVLDGTGAQAANTLKVQEPQTISDLTGGKDKTFGMRFNGFGGLAATTYSQDAKTTTEVSTHYYTTSPVLYTVTDPTAQVSFSTGNGATNTAVVKVRLK